MAVKIEIPNLGESVTEGTIDSWLVEDGALVQADQIVLELETDKAAMEIPSPAAGKLSIKVQAGETVSVGAVVGEVDDSVEVGDTDADASDEDKDKDKETENDTQAQQERASGVASDDRDGGSTLSPAVRRLVDEHGLDPARIEASGPKGNLTKGDVLAYLEKRSASEQPSESSQAKSEASTAPKAAAADDGAAATERIPMSRLRQRIAERLVQAQQTAAILTTFNEIDMSAVKRLRSDYKEAFEKKHGVRLGFMSLFGKACIQALQELPEVNAKIDGTDIVYNRHVNLGIAVGTKRGLVVPVVHKADTMSIAQLEQAIGEIALKARDGKITPDDLSGGTFTISNGGVYGSLLSTPILNPPQTGILGMHKIEDRAVVVDGEIVIRPMMYVALSYDHRIIDGEQAVTFLVRVKAYLEDPARMVLEI